VDEPERGLLGKPSSEPSLGAQFRGHVLRLAESWPAGSAHHRLQRSESQAPIDPDTSWFDLPLKSGGKIRLPGFPEFVSTRGGAYTFPAEASRRSVFPGFAVMSVDQTGQESFGTSSALFTQVIGLAQIAGSFGGCKFRPGPISAGLVLWRVPDALYRRLLTKRAMADRRAQFPTDRPQASWQRQASVLNKRHGQPDRLAMVSRHTAASRGSDKSREQPRRSAGFASPTTHSRPKQRSFEPFLSARTRPNSVASQNSIERHLNAPILGG